MMTMKGFCCNRMPPLGGAKVPPASPRSISGCTEVPPLKGVEGDVYITTQTVPPDKVRSIREGGGDVLWETIRWTQAHVVAGLLRCHSQRRGKVPPAKSRSISGRRRGMLMKKTTGWTQVHVVATLGIVPRRSPEAFREGGGGCLYNNTNSSPRQSPKHFGRAEGMFCGETTRWTQAHVVAGLLLPKAFGSQ